MPPKKTKTKLHPAEQYAQDVIDGRIVAGKWVRLACERYFHDLKHGHKRGLHFDREAAQRAIDFHQLLKHSKGKWAGTFIVLEPWQQFIVWNIFGWMKTGGVRRFNFDYEEMGRKNGKSTRAAEAGLLLAFGDGEEGAEVYSAATKRDQAKIVHTEAVRMVKANPSLKRHIKIYKNNLSFDKTNSKYEPLGADSDSTDGLNLSGAIIDEFHAWKTREMWDVLETATGSRQQPLIVIITTAGFDRHSICFEKHEYTRKVLEGWKDGSFVDDAWFGVIYSLDDEDKEHWQDERLWIKANPNLGVSKSWEDMRAKAKRASRMPASLNNFLRRELNMWTQSETKWMDMDKWRECAGPTPAKHLAEKLKGRVGYGGLDLSSTTDLTAELLVFPAIEDGKKYFDIVARFWLPEDAVKQRSQEGTHYEEWVREGYIEQTDGNVLDYEFVFAQMETDYNNFDIRRMAYDRWGAARVAQVLESMGMTVVPFGQGFASMSPPMMELERLVLSGQIRHGNNPVLTWMIDNVVASMDPAGNIKPNKLKSKEKIDGAVALIMALDQALRADDANMEEILEEDWGM